MPRLSLLDKHPKKRWILLALAKGTMTKAQISQKFGISPHTLTRFCLGKTGAGLQAAGMAKAREATAALAENSIAERVEGLTRKMERLLEEELEPRTKGQTRNAFMAVAAAREIRQCLELAAKLQGLLKGEGAPTVNVSITQNVLWMSIKDVILGATATAPEIRERIIRGIAALEGP